MQKDRQSANYFTTGALLKTVHQQTATAEGDKVVMMLLTKQIRVTEREGGNPDE